MTSDVASLISQRLKSLADFQKALMAKRFFKTGPSEYAEGDCFLGISVPQIRALAKDFISSDPLDLLPLIKSRWHEERLCCLIIWVVQSKKSKSLKTTKVIYDLYFNHLSQINNWDLVDVSAPQIVGGHLLKIQNVDPNPVDFGILECRDGISPAVGNCSMSGKTSDPREGFIKESILDKMATHPIHRLLLSPSMWERRIAIVSTLAWIKVGELEPTFRFAEALFQDNEDLIHKATGWMLREAGKKNANRLIAFIETHGLRMPRTMLRYAIERLDVKTRKELLLKTRGDRTGKI